MGRIALKKYNKNHSQLIMKEYLNNIFYSHKLQPIKNDDICAEAFNFSEQQRIATLLMGIMKNCLQDEQLKITANSFMRPFFWYATENNNIGKSCKYVGQPFWSKKAIYQYLIAKLDNYHSREKGLRHEHSIPIKLLIQKAWEFPTEVSSLIRKYSRAVILTKEEDDSLKKLGLNSNMPDGFNWENPNLLMRYESISGIEIYDTRYTLLNQLIYAKRDELKEIIQSR